MKSNGFLSTVLAGLTLLASSSYSGASVRDMITYETTPQPRTIYRDGDDVTWLLAKRTESKEADELFNFYWIDMKKNGWAYRASVGGWVKEGNEKISEERLQAMEQRERAIAKFKSVNTVNLGRLKAIEELFRGK